MGRDTYPDIEPRGCESLLHGGGPVGAVLRTGLLALEQQVQPHEGGHQQEGADAEAVSPAAVTRDTVEIELDGDWVQAVDIAGITPEPQEQVVTPYGLCLAVSAEPGAEVDIQITYRASEIGNVDAGVRFQDDTVPFRQFVYP